MSGLSAIEAIAALRLSLRLILRRREAPSRRMGRLRSGGIRATPWFETLACATLRQAPHHEAGRESAKTALAALICLVILGRGATAAGDRALGEYLSTECVACHQLSGRYQGIPPIVGWPEQSFVEIMDEYRSKRRSNPVMQTIAGKFSAEEIAALAAYFGSLKPKN
jgi:cytochrome c553